MIACIREQGARIRREGRRLIVSCRGEEQTLFAERLEQIFIFGNVQLTPQARSLILAAGIDTVFLRLDGRYLGRLGQGEGGNVHLRKRQFQLTDDESFCRDVARDIVAAKLHNQAVLLARIRREHDQPEAGAGAAELRHIAASLAEAASVEHVRGLEGAGAAVYFRHLPLAFHRDWGFSRRVRRPPTDPVNVVLSLLYTLLTARCHAACRLAGLDPYPAHLHTLEYGRHSLPLDLVEEWRAPLADALAISLFNTHMLGPGDFVAAQEASGEVEEEEPQMADAGDASAAGGEGTVPPPLLLRAEACKKVLGAFARKLETEFLHPHAGEHMSYARAIVHQVRQYRRLVEGEEHRYLPVLLK